MKPATKAKSVGRGKITAKRPVSARKPKTAPKKSTPKKKIAVVPPGLAFGEFEALRKQLDLSLDELTVRLGLSPATVAQRKAAGHLTNDESGKVVCFARLLGHAVHLFGDLEEARQWLKTPQRALHGAVPLDYAKTETGAQEVENLLSELGHGSPS
jgi:putative toxin-antitoxin system antitoxin component (TIGR02293 family)